MIWAALLVMGVTCLGAALVAQTVGARATPIADDETRICPSCGETICSTARMCRFCSRNLVPGLE